MQILFVTPYVPSPLRPRPYHFIRQLAERGHTVTLLALRKEAKEDVADIRQYCHQAYFFRVSRLRSAWNALRAIPSGLPLQAVLSWQPAAARLLRKLVDDQEQAFDIIHVEHLSAARYGLLQSHAVQAKAIVPVVWDSVDAEGLFQREASQQLGRDWRRFFSLWEAERIELYEGWLVNQFAHVMVTSVQDQRWLLSRQTPSRNQVDISVLPNGVDLEYFQPANKPSANLPTVLLSGDMSLLGNVVMAIYLVEEIMPQVWKDLPDTRVVIAGHNPAAPVRALMRDRRVKVTGTVDDIRPWIQQCTVAVAPLLYGLGIQNKVLEALACGRPVVATPQAVGGLAVQPEQDLLIAEDPVQYAKAIISVLIDPQLQAKLGQAGRRYVELYHPWPAAVDRLEAVYEKVTAKALNVESAVT